MVCAVLFCSVLRPNRHLQRCLGWFRAPLALKKRLGERGKGEKREKEKKEGAN